MKKTIAIAILVCVGVALVVTPVLAQEPVLVFPFFSPADIYIEPDQEVVIFTGWIACTRGLVRSFLTSIELEWDLDGETLLSADEAAEIWGPIQDTFPDGEPVDGDGCIAGNEGQAWLTLWIYSLGTLEEGDHPLSVNWAYTHPVNDGFDLDGDGRPDKYSGSDNWQTTIHVAAP